MVNRGGGIPTVFKIPIELRYFIFSDSSTAGRRCYYRVRRPAVSNVLRMLRENLVIVHEGT